MKKITFFLALLFLTVLSFGQTYRVKDTSDGIPFNYRMSLIEQNTDFLVYRVTFPSPKAPSWENAKNVIGFYFKPILPHDKTFAPRPAVLCMHILGGDGSITKGIASFFASKGLPAFMPMMPIFLERRPNMSMEKALTSTDGAQFLLDALEAVPGDITRSLDFLASLPEVDKEHLNVIGTSLGGILASHAIGANPRIDKGVFLLGGGDLFDLLTQQNKEVAPIAQAISLGTPRLQAKIKRAIREIEPLNYAHTLAQKAAEDKIRMYNAAEDQIVPYANSKKLADAIGLKEGEEFIIFPGVDHYTAFTGLPQLLDDALHFFQTPEIALAIASNAENSQDHDVSIIKGLFQELQRLISGTPAPGKEIDIHMTMQSMGKGKENFSGNLAVNMDADHYRFMLSEWKGLGDIGQVAFGKSDAPWATSGNGTQFLGDDTPAPSLITLLPSKITAYRQMGAFLCQTIASSGSLALLQQMANLTYDFTGDKRQNLDILVHGWNVLIQLDGYIPKSIQISQGDTLFQINFQRWTTDKETIAEDFMPAKEAPAKFKVNSDDLVRSLGAVISHGMTTLIVK